MACTTKPVRAADGAGYYQKYGCLLAPLIVFVSLPADEGLVIMKDGFALKGNVKRNRLSWKGSRFKPDGFFMVIGPQQPTSVPDSC